MCGRYSFGKTDRADWVRFGVPAVPNLAPNWNISPGSAVLAVRERTVPGAHAARDSAAAVQRETALLRWGLVPAWASEPAIGNRFVNARAESAHERTAFREAFRARRCLLPADAFYEWQAIPGQKRKQPWRVEPVDGGLLALGALWESWRGRAGEAIESCTILTVPANASLGQIHDRMPVIVAPGAFNAWLSPETPHDRVRDLCRPAPDTALKAWRISLDINIAANNDAGLARPLNADD